MINITANFFDPSMSNHQPQNVVCFHGHQETLFMAIVIPIRSMTEFNNDLAH